MPSKQTAPQKKNIGDGRNVWTSRSAEDLQSYKIGFLVTGDGKSLSEISFDLGVSYKTIANTVSQIKQKLSFTTTASLIKFAVELALKR